MRKLPVLLTEYSVGRGIKWVKDAFEITSCSSVFQTSVKCVGAFRGESFKLIATQFVMQESRL